MTYTKEQIDRANQTDLVSFLQAQGEQLERAGQEYRWKRHDSLTVRENRWYRHSQSKGGGPIDFVMEFYGKSFLEAVEMLIGERGEAPPPVYLQFRLPPKSPDNQTARNYLTAARRIDEDVSGFFFSCGDLYEEAAHHNAVFVGRDESGIPRYAHQRGTVGSFRLDVKGSDKTFNFCYRGEGERLFVFEAPIDLLSFLCLFKKEWQKQSYLSLGGVSEKALLRFLSDRPNIKTVYLCLDSDKAGTDACSRLNSIIPQGYTVNRLVPLFKDWNEVLQRKEEITDGKYLREAVYGLREPQQEETVEIIRMSEVDTQTVEWLWEPYIPFGKVTIVQGNPGEGKTTLALRLCAACTNRKPFPAMAEHEPFNVIYQTAEDGLGDTVKPRLMEADADLDRVLVIDEGKQELSLSDERIERAIRQTGARLIILDPIQAYVGEKTDMNKANEIRPIFRRLAEVAERTGCAVVLIGHLNKAAGGQSAYRGLGSIDFRAAARSVLLIGRVKREPNVRVIIHDKSSLAPEGKPMRSRAIIGDVACVNANSQTLKESLVKMIYSNPGGVPHILHVDNGKDYTAKAMTGQNRKHRKIDLDFAFDSETVGFYQSIGIQEVGRSLPYQPWDKPIERFFSTVCSKFSKWFESYTGTLTGSKTYAKRQKDIDQMLERGELLTMEEFFEVWTEWKNTKYHTRKHRGLSDAGEKWVTPIEMFENGPRYEKAAPPREYAAMLLMKAATARVTNQGINKFGTLYTDTELAYYVNQKVNIKWDINDVTKLYVYDMEGKKICEAVSAELLAFGPHCSQAALEKHLRDQKRNEREVREYLEERVRPYELRLEDGARPSDAVGMIDLTIKATPSQKLVSLPKDRMFRSEQASKTSRKKVTDDTFLNAKGDKALSLLRAMNE